MQKQIEIIPAIDLIEGKCVRLQQGDYSRKTIYHEDPVLAAKLFEETGLKRLHLVDLDGAKAGRIVNYPVLEQIARNTSLVIDFGGGLKTENDLKIAFNSGASMITGGSIAVKNREVFLQWLLRFGGERIILGADALEGKIAVSGWHEATSLDVIDFIEGYARVGISQVISTDIGRDGMLEGPATALYSEIMKKIPGIRLIASGGVSSIDDNRELAKTGVQGVITGKAIYENRISLSEITAFLTSDSSDNHI